MKKNLCMCEKSSIFATEMDKKRLIHSIEWAVAVVAYVYLVYKLATYEHYETVAASLCGMGVWQVLALVACVTLMPLNMWLEAWRWRTLMNEANDAKERMSWREAQRQVYYSKLAGLITPWRLGEYPARALLINDANDANDEKESQESRVKSQETWTKVLSMGAVGSVTMTMAIVSIGALALAFSPAVLAQLGGSYLYALLVVVAVLGIMLYFAPTWLKKWIKGEGNDGNESPETWTNVLWVSYGQSIVRLACWCVQLALVLYALNAFDFQFSIFNFQLLPIYYLLVTVTPNIPIVEAGVRGAWAMLLFGSVNAALAGVLLWAINTLLPCLIWPLLKKNA